MTLVKKPKNPRKNIFIISKKSSHNGAEIIATTPLVSMEFEIEQKIKC